MTQTLCRVAVRRPPGAAGGFEAAWRRELEPRLRAHGLRDPQPCVRPLPDSVVGRQRRHATLQSK